MFKVDVFNEKRDWNNVLRQFPQHDFGHTYDFHKLSEHNQEGNAVLFCVKKENNGYVMCWPGLCRPVEGTEYYDLTSVLEFSGPLIKDINLFDICLAEMLTEMRHRNIISVFAKLHPLISVAKFDCRFPTEHVGNVVVIDIQEQDQAFKGYRANHRRDIKRSLEMGAKVIIDETCNELVEFGKIYRQAMLDIGARDYYLFSDQYLHELARSTDFKAMLMFAIWDEIKIGAIMLLKSGGNLHYYLGGVNKDFKRLSPLKILLARAHEWAIEEKLDSFILGGGPGGLNGPLIHFKMGFSKSVAPFLIYKKILDSEKYDAVCRGKNVDPKATDFFPAYRS